MTHLFRVYSRAKPEFFKNGRNGELPYLDYPNATTDKASKKFLKGMKKLSVRLATPSSKVSRQSWY